MIRLKALLFEIIKESQQSYTDSDNPITTSHSDPWEYYFNTNDDQWYTRKKGRGSWINMHNNLSADNLKIAVDKLNDFIQLNKFIKTSTGTDISMDLGKLSKDNINVDVSTSKLSFSSRAKKDYEAGIINPNLIDDIIQALDIAGVTARIGTAKTGHAKNVKNSKKRSRHISGDGVDLDEFNGQGNSGGDGKNKGLGGKGGATFMANGDKVIEALKTLGYKWGESGNTKGFIWRSDTGGNHWNHIHVSNTNR